MKDMNKAMKKLQESKKIKLENYSFSEIVDMMEEADSYSELYDAASKIKDNKLKSDVNELIGQCEDDGDDVETAYSVVTSDLLDNKINDLNEDKLENVITEADEDDEEENEEAKRDAYYERTYKRIEEYQKNLDLTPLFNWIKEVTGISDLKFNVEKTNRNKDYRIEFESDNIIDKCGVMKFAFNDVRINSFGNGVTTTAPNYYDSEKIDYNKDYDLYYWVSLHFSYQLVEGGSNGCKFGRAMCKEGKWEFKLSNK